jgi:hypothetical protein
MQCTLTCHPDTPCDALMGIVAQVEEGRLRFDLLGLWSEIALPEPAPPVRTDGLWQTTCFELFVADDVGYREYNFSPSGAWAAYRFSDYREGVAELEMDALRIELFGPSISIEADLGIGDRAFALTAVIEEKSGAKSYWSLAHPPGKPDFHHRDCFVGKLPPSGAA